MATPTAPVGVAIVLHGGASRHREAAVSPTQLSVLRMIPVASRIARTTRQQVVVQRLLNSRRGWDPEHTPTADIAWALDEVAARFGADLPVCLIGHSLGGRAALLSANRPQVRGVVALAPWVYPNDDAPGLKDTPIVIVHGEHDRIASPERSRQVASRLRARTAVTYIAIRRGSHSMLGRAGTFDGLAARCTAWILLDEHDDPLIARIAAGATSLEV